MLPEAGAGDLGASARLSALADLRVPRVDFLICGAMKCATTTVKQALQSHPEVHMPEGETHFFGNHRRYLSVWSGGRVDAEALERVYSARFRTDRRVVGDKTPNYLISALTLERIQRFHPDARIVVMVRDPAERARSHWEQMRRHAAAGRIAAHHAAPTLAEQILRDSAELEGLRTPSGEVSGTNVLWRGFYSVHLRWTLRLFPRDRVFVGLVEDLAADADGFFRRLQEFLGLPWHRPAPAAVVPVARAGGRHALTPLERAALREIYAESVRDLEGLLGRDLSAWK